MVRAIFPNLCLWRHCLCSNLGGIDPEKLYRATLTEMEKGRKSLRQRELNCQVAFSYAKKIQNRIKKSLEMDKNINDDTATLMPGYGGNRDRLQCSLFGTTWNWYRGYH